jgi:hypothetical protein
VFSWFHGMRSLSSLFLLFLCLSPLSSSIARVSGGIRFRRDKSSGGKRYLPSISCYVCVYIYTYLMWGHQRFSEMYIYVYVITPLQLYIITSQSYGVQFYGVHRSPFLLLNNIHSPRQGSPTCQSHCHRPGATVARDPYVHTTGLASAPSRPGVPKVDAAGCRRCRILAPSAGLCPSHTTTPCIPPCLAFVVVCSVSLRMLDCAQVKVYCLFRPCQPLHSSLSCP